MLQSLGLDLKESDIISLEAYTDEKTICIKYKQRNKIQSPNFKIQNPKS